MKLALIGYGKMGHAVERIARERGHEIVSVIDKDNLSDFDSEAFCRADAAIEFTTPSTAVDNIKRSVDKGVPVVCGSTGWYDAKSEVDSYVTAHDSALLATSNFSIGVNVMFEINSRLARMMNSLPQYSASLSETHHIHKLDHPSGTAITLLNEITTECDRYHGWEETDKAETGMIPVTCIRRDEVPGIHSVSWDSAVDTITITHDAHSRDGFALGAVMAAEWIAGKKGIFTMRQMLTDLNIL
ncbi:MAG: 4-hydroxy-tetrahydrodipicolinate reductase [Lachnoclostridium sp.]|nr:4-hydroxy-tetrahydrodipicolinate reductase [Lachnoclostridium sp.]